ncbi:MAG TPA: oligopeptide transporter, OPT family [Cyclobacteriaceae bacterium]|nr:oligopeptide transporter, OPT family [Cyclobacteriaceae bacterium]HMV10397.1 oligopeptide transporter, OPT family [Cyclobacteriaceae bacterium]HMV90772.1 oligopeptide transporter, OPT family [Cyclobacteriaceae bacterium]HMX00422.1 oligopeptide transporter, OPT family [Cyclobacteriaceae bacterium]HMX50494.1 oligopeptide transporter, OPT family [Cyclobacteriaceae bacterium]
MEVPKMFKPYIAPEQNVAEFTVKSIVFGCLFGIIFGCSTTYLALKAGLTVSASIPIAVIAITLGRKFLKTTILENNIIQTTGSAGESIAAGVVFTLPGFLFLSPGANGESYFNYLTILILAAFGGMLGTLMMIPLRRSLIVKEHGTLPYPEGTACASVLQAGEKGGVFAQTAFMGMGIALLYAILQKVLHVIAEVPAYVTKQTNKFWPSATINGEITPEYLGVGYIIGPKISGVLVAGSVLAWWAMIPLMATLVSPDLIAMQLVKVGYLADVNTGGGPGNWDPATHTFANSAAAIYRAYIRQIGAGAVAAGGFITLMKTIPTIISSFRESIGSLKEKNEGGVLRTERDFSFKVVIVGSLILVAIIALLPNQIIPGDNIFQKIFIGILIIIFGFFFVTVASRIVGLVGSSNSPISGMTIATLMGTCLIFTSVGWSGYFFEPLALVVGGMICIAAANAGGTSQDLKTGFIVGATPKYQQLALFIGAIVSSIAIGWVVQILDTPTADMAAQGITHAIGSERYSAPQATLMATLAKGILSFNLDWQFVMVGVFIAVMIELCGIKALAFAIGLYLPLSTTLPIFIGGAIKGLIDWRAKKKNEVVVEDDLGRGSLFATGLIAGGALAGVIVAVLSVNDNVFNSLKNISAEHGLTNWMGAGGYQLLAVAFFATMAFMLYRQAIKKTEI